MPTPEKGSPSAAWLWSIVGLVGVGYLVVIIAGHDDTNSSSNIDSFSLGPSAPSTYSPSLNAPSNPLPSSTGNSGLEFVKPPIGTDEVLSAAQIRWCLREDIRIEAKRPYLYTEREVEEFNATVAEYNWRCVSFQYSVGTMEDARREVEALRSQIVAQALGSSNAPPTPQITPSPALTTVPDSSNSNDTDESAFQTESTLHSSLDRLDETNCQLKPVMTDQDYRDCGLNPPTVYPYHYEYQ